MHHPPTHPSIRSFEITCVDMWLDIGAHIGVFTSLALAAGAEVVSVEPDKDNFAILEKNSVRTQSWSRVW